MKDIFEMVVESDKEKGQKKEVRLALRVSLGGRETLCPVSEPCRSYDAFEAEIRSIERQLGSIRDKAKDLFFRPSGSESEIGPDMDAEEIWEILSGIVDENTFIDRFNKLDEIKRKEVSDHVLTRCNIFSGRAAVFSSRYNSTSALLE